MHQRVAGRCRIIWARQIPNLGDTCEVLVHRSPPLSNVLRAFPEPIGMVAGRVGDGIGRFNPRFLPRQWQYRLLGRNRRLMCLLIGYELDGVGLQLFDRIQGDYLTTLGAPIFLLFARLREIGFMAS